MEFFTCPRGHVLNEDEITCTIDLTVDDIDKAIIFTCPKDNYHDFTLKRALKTKMFSEEQAAKIRVSAEEHRRKHGYKVKAN